MPISVAALHSIFAHTDSLKLYVTMLIGYAENAVPLHLSLSQCLKLLISKRLFFKNTVVKTAVTIKCGRSESKGATRAIVSSVRGTAKKGEMKSKDQLGEWERENSIYLKHL